MGRILSEGEYEYLRGEAEVENGGARERTIRNRIRNHIKQTVKEFRVVHDTVEGRDKEQVYDEIDPSSETEYLYRNFTDADETTLEQGLVAMVSFVYEACQNSDLEFETVVERAIDEHHQNDTTVTLEVNDLSEVDVEEAARKYFIDNDEVSDKEVEAMRKRITRKIGEDHDLFTDEE